jgi:hypothetical protein
MTWLWILLRCLFPADPIRQTAEAMRHRVAQLIHISQDKAQLAELLINPAFRLHLEQLILDAEDCLRLWIAMRGHQIARIRPRLPRDRATPHLTHAKDLFHLLARIAALADDCDHMEQRAQSHAQKLRQLRDADPLGAHGSPQQTKDAARCAVAHSDAAIVARFQLGLILRDREAIVSKDEAVLTALASARAPPHSIAGATP